MNSLTETLRADLGASRDPTSAVRDLYGRAVAGGSAACADVLDALEVLLRSYPVEQLGMVAVLAGALVERTGDPERFPPAIFDRLAEMLALVPEEEGAQEDRDAFELPPAYDDFERAAMAALSRSADYRRGLPQRGLLQSRMRRYSERYGFLGKMLAVLDDEPLIVVDPAGVRAWRCRIGGIADNFQLHTLLLGALGGTGPDRLGGPTPSPEAVAAAGAGPLVAGQTVVSRWQLANWFALRPDGTLASDRPDAQWIWNEGVPADIATFEGSRVVLVGPSGYPRSWDAQRIFPGMRGELTVDGSIPDARDLLARLLQPAR